jgi:uncharacterized protein YjdB
MNKMSKFASYSKGLTWSAALLLSALAAGCGGGGGQDSILGGSNLISPNLVSVAVTPATPSIPTSGIQQFTATATYIDGSTVNVTASANWASATTSIATVVPTTGVATGVSAGTSVVTAAFGGKTATATLTVSSATLVSIAVSPATFTVGLGGPRQFTVIATFSDGSSIDVTGSANWTSGTPGVATISPTTGAATGVASGTSVITAAFAGKTATSTLTVTTATLQSIAVTPAPASTSIGGTKQFAATATYSDASTLDVTASSSWTSGTTSVATVGASTGVATGVAGGASVITAAFGGKTATATLTVSSATLQSIAVTPATSSIPVSASRQFTATATYSDASTLDVTASTNWTSGTTSVATVLLTTGAATGVAGGTSVITAAFGGKTATATLTVTSVTLQSIAVTPAPASASVGGTRQFTATATYSDASTVDVTSSSNWTSGTTSVATVLLTSGMASGVKSGTSVITAAFGGKTATANLTVSPAPVALGTAGNFVALTKTGITTTGVTKITGDIGVSPITSTAITGFGLIMDSSNQFATSSLVTGKIFAADYAVPTPANMTTAVSNMETAYTDAAGRAIPDATELGAGNITGMTITPGLYKWSTGVSIDAAGTVTLSGGANDVWIFQIAGDLTVNPGASVTLLGGASAKNIFWQVGGGTGVTLDTTSAFQGTILAIKAIVMKNGATLNGRALAQTNVTLIANTIAAP